MLCEPSASADVENVATPPESEPVPIVVEPSLNATVPVAVPAPGAVTATVAVNVTDSPTTDGFCDDASDVLVEAVFTVCVVADDVLPPKSLLPRYCAVKLCEPSASDDVLNVAEQIGRAHV